MTVVDVRCGDCCELMDYVPDGSQDVCVTDLAYESLEKHRAVGTTTRLKKAWFPVFPNKRFPEFFSGLHRVMRKDGHVYLFTDKESMFPMHAAAVAAGFTFWNALTWDKGAIGMGYHYRRQTEMILFLTKGKGWGLRNLGVADLIRAKAIRKTCKCDPPDAYGHCGRCGGYVAYPTEKPGALVDLLLWQSMPDYLQQKKHAAAVFDPQCGSGVVGESAVWLGASSFLGFDVCAEATLRTERRCGCAAATTEFVSPEQYRARVAGRVKDGDYKALTLDDME
jgi:site-specific DNA-methyltransferase (adenine-specific)